MSGSKNMLLRIQSPEGTQRIEISPSSATSQLYEKIYEELRLKNFAFALHKDRLKTDEIVSSRSKQIKECGLRHGDMIYLSAVNGSILFDEAQTDTASKKPVTEPGQYDAMPGSSKATVSVQEDEIDLQLYKMDGKIQRGRDEKLCRHGSNGSCVHCSPLEPFDEGYLKAQNVKHLSFHSYLRKLCSGVDRGKFLALDDIKCKIKPGCKEHPPWPRGVCSKCQPSAVTLNRQQYRHVDNVVFDSGDIVERFLTYWRATGHQRIGFLYGRYELHADVPLGIRARVSAIYEPPQSGSRDAVTLHEEAGAGSGAGAGDAVVERVAAALGLRRVGWIFTDLLPDAPHGTVQHIRGVESHLLSAQECIMAAHLQNQHPSPSRYAASGHFGSKFVTVCVTGDSNKQIHMEGYQVSGQCMALVRDGCLVPTRDAPELGYVRPSTDRQYVPDVFYKEKDMYGNEVQRVARPLPVLYLIVDVPAGSLQLPRAAPPADVRFPPAHRPLSAHLQTLQALHAHVAHSDSLLNALSDLDVLVYLASNETLSLSEEEMAPLLAAVRDGDARAVKAWAASCESWATLCQLMSASEPHSSEAGAGGAAGGETWTCPHCTFDNPGNRDTCEICVLPRGSGGM